jgi:hypothetical protein
LYFIISKNQKIKSAEDKRKVRPIRKNKKKTFFRLKFLENLIKLKIKKNAIPNEINAFNKNKIFIYDLLNIL